MQEDCGAAELRAPSNLKQKFVTFAFWALAVALAACAFWRMAESVAAP